MRKPACKLASSFSTAITKQSAFSPEPWIWRHDSIQEKWAFPVTLAISRSWKDVDAFCKYILASHESSSTPFFIEIGVKRFIKNLTSYSCIPYEYILFGTFDAMMLVLHGYPIASPEMATFGKVLKHGLLSKLYWSSESDMNQCPYYLMTGKALGKSWCNLALFFQMLEVKTEIKPLPDSLASLVNQSNVDMWKRTDLRYSSKRLLASPSRISVEDLQKEIAAFFSKIAQFRSVIRDAQPTILWMNNEDEKEFSQYYLNDKNK